MGHYKLNSAKGKKLFSAWTLLVLILLTFSLSNGQAIGAFNCAILGLVMLLPGLVKVNPKENTLTVVFILGVTALLFLVQISPRQETAFAYYGTGLFYLVTFLAATVVLVRRYSHARAVPIGLAATGLIIGQLTGSASDPWVQATLCALVAHEVLRSKLRISLARSEGFLPALALGAVLLNWALNAKDWVKLAAQVSLSTTFELGNKLERTLLALNMQSSQAQSDSLPEVLKLGLDLGLPGALAYMVLTGWAVRESLKTQRTRRPYALIAGSFLVLGLGYPLLSQPWMCAILGLLLALGFRPTKKSPKVYVIAVAAWTLALSTLTLLQPIWFLHSYAKYLEKGVIAESVFLSKPNVERALDNQRYATPFKALGALKLQQANKAADLIQAEEFAKLSIYFYSQAAAIEPRCGLCFEKMADAAKSHIPSVSQAQLKEAYEKALSLNPKNTVLTMKIEALNAK